MDDLPEDFSPNITTYKGKVIYEAKINGFAIKCGYPQRDDTPTRRKVLHQEIWEAHQHARAGNHHLIGHLAANRHSGHKISAPELPTEQQ